MIAPAHGPVTPVRWCIGLDVGSTTVKAVVVEASAGEIVWRRYQRHNTKQSETVLRFLDAIEEAIPGFDAEATRIFVTGSGGSSIAGSLGAKFVQEVNAVCLAVERMYPECNSVIELGGQDAKIIVFREDPATGRKKKLPSMNDKCAGGTGSVIDKIAAKLGVPAEQLGDMGYTGLKLHPVAGKCGVFAETDVNSLQKQGVSPEELMASLFEAIIQQNLTVLTRGHTLRPSVLLLGGPNTFIRGMQECWRANLPKVWVERGVEIPEGTDPGELVVVPDDALYFAAIGVVEYGKEEPEDVGRYRGRGPLADSLSSRSKTAPMRHASERGLADDEDELAAFRERHAIPPFRAHRPAAGDIVEAFLGIDGGSTSTKAVLLSRDREVLFKAYGLSKGNPIEDTKARVSELRSQVEAAGARLEILGVGTTGYAKDVLKDVLKADAAIVETVAHTESALHFYDDVDVVCDVGGQDIKVIVLNDRKVKDFKLNTQCSAGNGYFLQSTAAAFDVDVRDYADTAFEARRYPLFGYGCAVFMQSDIVDFQRQGWSAGEILAGLAAVLPKNIWLYVSQIPNLAQLGRNFVLQGGTQYNLAAVKAQVDFITERFNDDGGRRPNVFVHEHAGESGAIGAALEAARLHAAGIRSDFIGLDAVERIDYRTTRNESTRCFFCKNKCLRTFIDVSVDGALPASTTSNDRQRPVVPAAELPDDTRRLIIATCEKGEVEDIEAMRRIKAGMDDMRDRNPNLVEYAARRVWRDVDPSAFEASRVPRLTVIGRSREQVRALRQAIRIGMPRTLNMYSVAPFFTGYFRHLGVPFENLVFSDFTSEELYRSGANRGSIDPCFPSKVALAHVHNLLFKHHDRKKLDVILFPMVDALPSPLTGIQASRACPTVTATPEAVKAAFTKEGDAFAERDVRYLSTFVDLSNPALLKRQMLTDLGPLLDIGRGENGAAVDAGLEALAAYERDLRAAGASVLRQLEEEERIGIVVLGRPYHNDPGINHEILLELQRLGYPILTVDSLPVGDDVVHPLFADQVAAGVVRDGRDISDVWKNSYSENTNRKVWAAKFVAAHPWLVALDFSSFKCGHDAPIYSLVEEIVERSGTPFFSFRDMDENKPTGSIKIRVETISYFLMRYRQELVRRRERSAAIDAEVARFEASLRAGLPQPL